jgi:dihydrofolate synthase/folylpolyglutamate synthase
MDVLNFERVTGELFARRSNLGCGFVEFRNFAEKFLPKNSRSRIIHVAGTNGKGSVCALLEAAYRAAGYVTGMFTSPHLVDVRERVQCGGVPISGEDFCRIFFKIGERCPLDLSFFQYLTLIALVYFYECAVDVMIIECGIGGRLDSTNVVCADASIIASVALDHEEILGSTLEDIAWEKAGIIKPGAKVFIGDIPQCAEATVESVSRENRASLIKASGGDQFFKSNLRGDCQKGNARLACAALKNLRSILPISDSAIGRGYAEVFWPARNQTIFLRNGNEMIFDGAHNGEAVRAQRDYIARTVHRDSTTLIFSSTKVRHYESCFAILEPLFHRIFVTNISEGRGNFSENLLVDLAGKYTSKCQFIGIQACIELLTRPTDEVYFATGSLLLIGELARLLIAVGQLDSRCFLSPLARSLLGECGNYKMPNISN